MDFGFQTLDSSFCQWNLDSVFQSLVGFRIPWAVFRIPKPRISDSYNCTPDSKAQDSGFLQLYSGFQRPGFRIPTAVLRIPTPRIPDSYSCTPDSKAQDSGFLQLYSGFQSAGFRIPQAQNFPDSGIRIPLHGPLQDFSGMISVIVALKAYICCGSILSLV